MARAATPKPAVFVLGAGATRGASFCKSGSGACLPPLDADFFTQLQRIKIAKLRPIVDKVLEDVTRMFGQNFSLTMEQYFATLEHTIRMLEVTESQRRFSTDDLKTARTALLQSLAAVFEGSLCKRGREPQACAHHTKLASDLISPGDSIISFNYDCTIDYALKNQSSSKWNAKFGYGFPLGPRGGGVEGWKEWCSVTANTQTRAQYNGIRLLKLHGSMHFKIEESENAQANVTLKVRPYTRQNDGEMRFTILPPESNKAYGTGVFATLWSRAAKALKEAKHLVVIGYSLPPSDLHTNALFRTSVDKLDGLVVVNPDPEARRRIRGSVVHALHSKTRVLSVSSLAEFASMDKSLWRH